MKITDVSIDHMEKGVLNSLADDGLKHIKVLPCLSIAQAVEGSYEFAVGGEAMQSTGKGGFFIAPPDVQQTIVHRVDPKSGKMSCRWIFLYAKINGSLKPEDAYSFPRVIKAEDSGEIAAAFERMFSTGDLWENYGDAYKLMGALLRCATPICKTLHDGVQRALAFISEHYREPISVADIARTASTSESNFFALFRKHVGESPISYINHYRASAAAARLVSSDESVCEIAASVGVTDALYFSKLFKKTYGMSPRDYRETYRKKQ